MECGNSKHQVLDRRDREIILRFLNYFNREAEVGIARVQE